MAKPQGLLFVGSRLPLGMGQKDIASFFGGKPAAKALAAAPSSAGKSIKSKKASPQVLKETSNAAGKKRAREVCRAH